MSHGELEKIRTEACLAVEEIADKIYRELGGRVEIRSDSQLDFVRDLVKRIYYTVLYRVPESQQCLGWLYLAARELDATRGMRDRYPELSRRIDGYLTKFFSCLSHLHRCGEKE